MRVGLVVAADDVRTWMVTLASLLERDGPAELVAIIVVDADVAAWVPPTAGPIQRGMLRIDDRLFGRPGDPLSSVDPDALWPTVARIDLTAFVPGTGLDARAGAALTDAGLDVIVQPVGRPMLALSGFARHGVWAFEHGGSGVRRMAPGVSAVLGAHETLCSELVAVDADGRRTVLARTWSAPDPSSVRRFMNHVLAKLAAYPSRVVARLARQPDAMIDAVALAPSGPARVESKVRSSASADRAVARALPGHVGRLVGRLPERLIRPARWILAEMEDVPPGALPDPGRQPVRLIRPPGGDSWADPFPVDHDGELLVFMEEWSPATRKGRIALLSRAADGSWGPAQIILDGEVHLSYPFVFSWQGEWYLMPESMAGSSLDLYRATDFPTGWTFDRRVMEGARVTDATIAEIDGAWWMFATIAPDGAVNTDELHLFSGPGPLGPWQPHRANPVVSDVRSARPAGRPFRHDGVWYRPSQDCSRRYGRAIVLSRIERLDLDAYEERAVARIGPEWTPGGLGTHTLNRAGRFVLLDASVRDRPIWRR